MKPRSEGRPPEDICSRVNQILAQTKKMLSTIKHPEHALHRLFFVKQFKNLAADRSIKVLPKYRRI
jgi:hypothetical protein